ncbi:toll/interleukin-1 receptor domain-containing protein [Chryseobacterium sp. MA9]|uniref:toll/interleukin-1 receptor domain-containing protein n=1 Tax=Chryseobacterium sp. MA9 TaxID=2966625 RepID=UPI0021023D17|nr:toll/interleukin-1 receptor domain-containing protein [Chryseobacterium sp. MA9]UTX46668.1 tetratricopeptide repeat protein [Chryseobacterium sp. MA9]
MKKTPEIFLSHCWSNKDDAEKIYNNLSQVGVKVKMDNHVLNYKDSIVSFMESIRDCDFAILLVSDDYLKSKNCLFEVLNLLKEKSYDNKILPIILSSAKIYSPIDRIKYLHYWMEQRDNLDNLLKSVNPIDAIDLYTDLKIISNITQSIDGFLKNLTSNLNITLQDLEKEGYKQIFEKIGFIDISYITELINISLIENIEEKEIELDKYLLKFPHNTFYYGIKAETYSKNGKLQQAKFAYEQSIKMDENNTSSLNNLGHLCHVVLKEYDSARKYFEKAIRIFPEFTIARLNLGVLLSQHYKEFDKAIEQYEAILEYDYNEPKAHNNLGNLYKLNDFKKANFHFNKAIELEPDYIDPYINLGNILKLRGELKKGNDYYRLALKRTTDSKVRKFINILLKTHKG